MSKTIIITGASGNLGRAVTSHLLEQGYRVIATITSNDSRENLPQKGRLQAEVVNLADENETTAFVERMIGQHGKIDGALLLVGGFAMGDIAATSAGDIRRQMELNFETAYHITRPLFQHMKANGNGRIVFVGARPAVLAAAGKDLIAYGLSKSLLFTLADYLNAAAKGTNVTATVVVPSTLDTPVNRKSMPGVDPNNWVKPEALAEILEFVLSDKGSSLRETVLKVYNNA